MALVKKSDIEDLQRLKNEINSVLEGFKLEAEVSSLKFSSSEAELIEVISDGITLTGANSSDFEELVNILNGNKGLISQTFTEILVGENKYAFGGDQVFELTDLDYAEAKEDEWTDARAQFDSAVKQRRRDIDDAAEARFNTLHGAILDTTEKDHFQQAYQDLKTAFENYSKEDFENVILKSQNELMTPIANDFIINNIDNNDLLNRYNEEKAERKEAVEDSFVKQNRVGSILKGVYDDITVELDELTDDTEIVSTELKEEMNINGDDDLVSDLLDNMKKDNKVFDAFSAIKLTRESIFDLNIGGIIDKIKEACYKGDTKIQLTGDEISGAKIYALVEYGYKVTHQKIKAPGRNKDNTLFTIDWISAEEK